MPKQEAYLSKDHTGRRGGSTVAEKGGAKGQKRWYTAKKGPQTQTYGIFSTLDDKDNIPFAPNSPPWICCLNESRETGSK